MEKDGMPPSYLTTPAGATLSPSTKDTLLSKWNALFGNRYKLDLTLEQGMDIKTVGQSISFNVDRFKEINETLKKDITFIFQIPLSKITGENANYATAQINEKAFYDSAIKPIAKQISDGFTDYFRRIGYSDVLIGFEEKEFDLSNLQGITQDISNSVNDNNSNNEENKQLRKQLELKEKQVTEIEKQFIWKSYENIRDKYEKTIYKRLYDVKQSIIKSVKEDIQKASTEKDYNIEITITKDKIFDMIVKKLKVPASNLIKYTLRNVLNNLTGSVIQVNEEAVINSVLKRFYEKAIISSDNMLEQMKNEIKQIVNKPIDEYITVIDKISSHFSVKTSTNTVTTYSMNNTIKDVALLNKDKTKLQWLSQRDMSVRDAHAEADGQTIESDGMFNIGGELMSHPAGGSVAENNINCRCYMKVIKSEI
jgi:ribosomal protein S10